MCVDEEIEPYGFVELPTLAYSADETTPRIMEGT